MKKRDHSPPPELRISIVSMLDLVFNILAFFVMTYQPPIAIKDYEVALPPPKANQVSRKSSESFSMDTPETFNDLSVMLEAAADGTIGRIVMESKVVPATATGLQLGVVAEIKRLSEKIGGGIEAINIASPKNLKYKCLVGVVEACEQAGIKKINFVEGG